MGKINLTCFKFQISELIGHINLVLRLGFTFSLLI